MISMVGFGIEEEMEVLKREKFGNGLDMAEENL